MALFDNFDWGALGRSVLTGVAGALPTAVIGAYSANRTAKANNQAANMVAGNAQAQIDLTRENRDMALKTAEPALSQFRAIAGQDPNVLTPQQQIQTEDAMRGFNDKNLLGTVGGRSYSKMYGDTRNRINAGTVEANRGRQMQANSSIGNIANQQANTITSTGRDQVNLMGNATDAQANAVTANAQNNADVLGQIGSYFATAMKDADRSSRYKDTQDIGNR